jgi:hypothetical protein
LRKIGGWDPYNVTEDADLGMRLARFGYRTGVIDSTTYEEAPAHLGPWLRQRTRWFKGWMQTWLVHMRRPARLLRNLGLPGFLTFQLIVGGNALAALVHPLFMGGLICALASGAPMWRGDSAAVAILAGVDGVTAIIGSDVGLPRLARPGAPRPAVDRLGSAVDAAALAAAVARRLARALSTRSHALCLGKDRARPSEKLAAGRQFDAAAADAGAPPQCAQGCRRFAGTFP